MIMQIKRNILGTDVVIDLTEGEILDAHYEAERYNTREMLNERLMQEENIIDEIPAELFGKMVDEVMQEKDAMDENMGSNIFPAMNAVIEKHKDELKKEEQYKVFSKEVTLTMTHEYTIKAKNKEDAERIFNAWSESRHGTDQMLCDLTEDVQYDGDWDYGYCYEDNQCDPDNADISEEDI